MYRRILAVVQRWGTAAEYDNKKEPKMKLLFAADGSKFTKKALAFLVTHEAFTVDNSEVVVLNCQPTMPPRVRAMVGAQAVNDYYREEAAKVLRPIETFLKRHGLAFRARFEIGPPDQQILRMAERENAHMIVMGTHGHGLLGRAVMGSVAQRVVAGSTIPVLLAK
jgi:nucleotide-binding universal stress UspA family protein